MNKQIIRNFDEFLNEEEEFDVQDQDLDIYEELDGELDGEFEYGEEDYDSEDSDYDSDYDSDDDSESYYSDEEVLEAIDEWFVYEGEYDSDYLNEDNKPAPNMVKPGMPGKKTDPKALDAAKAAREKVKRYTAAVASQILAAKDLPAIKAIVSKPIPPQLGDFFKGKPTSALLPQMAARFTHLAAAFNKGSIDKVAFDKANKALAVANQKAFMDRIKKMGKEKWDRVKGFFNINLGAQKKK